ncbi:MAG: hypothetical protein HN644_10190 [Rhodospirillales bacterium]|jgi:hypothetical protein|nr:hypothetical protein [Rhodospirillales bacterium]MBT4041342.1 hypothetical protein [Rhodospirillales bacterium]MBT4626266.1 hypothetical protein [Rhodospirillales bacterium]MBT5353066.1 hypothetical protein [Rhodospirillales bacterium]MBT5520544.1 hypothetical protein [Rhodospirillales bacterium]
MDNTTIILGTICVFIAIFLAVRFEYRRSSCQYGGADTGHNNWLLGMIKERVKAIAKKRAQKVVDVCDY